MRPSLTLKKKPSVCRYALPTLLHTKLSINPRLMGFIQCCAYVILRLGKNIFTFIWWFVKLCLLLSIVKR